MKMFAAALEAVGVALLAAAAFTVSTGGGLAVLGAGAVVFGLAMER